MSEHTFPPDSPAFEAQDAYIKIVEAERNEALTKIHLLTDKVEQLQNELGIDSMLRAPRLYEQVQKLSASLDEQGKELLRAQVRIKELEIDLTERQNTIEHMQQHYTDVCAARDDLSGRLDVTVKEREDYKSRLDAADRELVEIQTACVGYGNAPRRGRVEDVLDLKRSCEALKDQLKRCDGHTTREVGLEERVKVADEAFADAMKQVGKERLFMLVKEALKLGREMAKLSEADLNLILR